MPENPEPLHTTESLLEWIRSRNATVHVSIHKIALDQCKPWKYDAASGTIRNPTGSFFQISGLQVSDKRDTLVEQPVLLQNEIGYLGIIRKRIGGQMHYLMQAKIEPGNINKIQLSPTIQATKSNFTQKHGGARPAYLDYLINARKYKIIVDRYSQNNRPVSLVNETEILSLNSMKGKI